MPLARQKLSSQFSVCLTYLPMTRKFVKTLTGVLFLMRMGSEDVNVEFVQRAWE